MKSLLFSTFLWGSCCVRKVIRVFLVGLAIRHFWDNFWKKNFQKHTNPQQLVYCSIKGPDLTIIIAIFSSKASKQQNLVNGKCFDGFWVRTIQELPINFSRLSDFVFRGPFARPVEKCYYALDNVSCEVIDYAIENYANYPELFLVDNEFCDYWLSCLLVKHNCVFVPSL